MTFPNSTETRPNDLLKTEPLQRPLMARLGKDDPLYDVIFIDVETGASRIDVCGKSQNVHFGDFWVLEDWDGNKFDPDDFYNEINI